MKKELLEKITDHLLTDIKPSTYMKSIEDDLWGTPLQIINELKTVEQSPKYHPEGNVYNHVMLVVDKAAQLRNLANSKKEFMLAALYMMLVKRKRQKRIARETTHHIIMIKLVKK